MTQAYDRLKALLEELFQFDREHHGEFLVVDVTNGEHELDPNEAEAFDRSGDKNPEGLFYLMRVGYRAAHRIGAR